ncbi:MAG: hypothetical protein ACRDTH_00420 [Pseudonocardiaceae bacterium]
MHRMVDRLPVLDAGGVYYSDRDVMIALIDEALEELVSTVPGR